MPDEVIAWAEEACNEAGVIVEIDTFNRRVWRKAGTVEDQELEPLAEWQLTAPGRTSANDAPVDEHEPLHGAILRVAVSHSGRTAVKRCNEVGLISPIEAHMGCYKVVDMLRPG